MTTADTSTRLEYSGNDVTTEFTITFPFNNNSEVVVVLVDNDGSPTTQVDGVDYNITGGDTVEMTTAPATGEVLIVRRELPFTQEIDLENTDSFDANLIEGGFDNSVRLLQQLNDEVSRSLRISDSTVGSFDLTLPNPQADSLIGFNADGDALETKAMTDGSEALPSTSDTYLRRNSTGTSFEAKTPSEVWDDVVSDKTASAAFTSIKQAATDSDTGVVELATDDEVTAGTDATKALTPSTYANNKNRLSMSDIKGLTLSNNSTDADHDIDIEAGYKRDAEDTLDLRLTSGLTKQLDAAWASGTDAGGFIENIITLTGTYSTTGTSVTGSGTSFVLELRVGDLLYNATTDEYRAVTAIASDTGATIASAFTSDASGEDVTIKTALAQSTSYSVYLISDGSSVDVCFIDGRALDATAGDGTLTATAKTEIGTQTLYSTVYYSYLGSPAITDASSNILGFYQKGDYFYLDVIIQDVEATNPGTSAVTATLSTPTGVRTIWNGIIGQSQIGAASQVFLLVTSLDQTDTAPSGSARTISATNEAELEQTESSIIPTNTSSQIRYRVSLSTAGTIVGLWTRGWIDTRGKQ